MKIKTRKERYESQERGFLFVGYLSTFTALDRLAMFEGLAMALKIIINRLIEYLLYLILSYLEDHFKEVLD